MTLSQAIALSRISLTRPSTLSSSNSAIASSSAVSDTVISSATLIVTDMDSVFLVADPAAPEVGVGATNPRSLAGAGARIFEPLRGSARDEGPAYVAQ